MTLCSYSYSLERSGFIAILDPIQNSDLFPGFLERTQNPLQSFGVKALEQTFSFVRDSPLAVPKLLHQFVTGDAVSLEVFRQFPNQLLCHTLVYCTALRFTGLHRLVYRALKDIVFGDRRTKTGLPYLDPIPNGANFDNSTPAIKNRKRLR